MRLTRTQYAVTLVDEGNGRGSARSDRVSSASLPRVELTSASSVFLRSHMYYITQGHKIQSQLYRHLLEILAHVVLFWVDEVIRETGNGQVRGGGQPSPSRGQTSYLDSETELT